jgi:hypothetical protein
LKIEFLAIEAPCIKVRSRHGRIPGKEDDWLCQSEKSFLWEAAVYLLSFGSIWPLARPLYDH